MLGIDVKSAVKCHLFTPPWLPGEPAPAAEKKILEETLGHPGSKSQTKKVNKNSGLGSTSSNPRTAESVSG